MMLKLEGDVNVRRKNVFILLKECIYQTTHFQLLCIPSYVRQAVVKLL